MDQSYPFKTRAAALSISANMSSLPMAKGGIRRSSSGPPVKDKEHEDAEEEGAGDDSSAAIAIMTIDIHKKNWLTN